jgi:hypothetical protein
MLRSPKTQCLLQPCSWVLSFFSGMLWASMLHQLCCQIWISLWPCSWVSSRFFTLLAHKFCWHILTSPWPFLYNYSRV